MNAQKRSSWSSAAQRIWLLELCVDTVSYNTRLNSDSDSYGASLHTVGGKILVMENIGKFKEVNGFTKFLSSNFFLYKFMVVRIFSCANITHAVKRVLHLTTQSRKIHACQSRNVTAAKVSATAQYFTIVVSNSR